MTPTLRRPHPLWIALCVLVLAALACNMGQPDVVGPEPTTRPRPTSTDEPEEDDDDIVIPDIDLDPDDINNGNNGSDGLTRDERENLIAATVQIFGLFEQGGELMVGYTGSGTVLTRDGLILTNAHVASPASRGNSDFEPDALGVALIEAEDEPPVASYLAEVLAVDGFLDLAVIQVAATLDGNRVDPDDLNLPFVPLGDSDEVRVGDQLNIFGFPGIGGETLTFTTGNVSGFTAEEPIGNRAWIKTDATISGGNSGGLGADDDGNIIGVPTSAGSGGQGDITDCRVVQDTNGDGVLDRNDTCVPLGGFINALRPINLALPLLEAAEKGLAYESPYSARGQQTQAGSGREQFGEIVWYSVDEDGNLDRPVTSYPSGGNVLVATFEFANMTNGQTWGEQWYLGEDLIYEDAYAWDQGEDGEYYTWISSGDNPLDDGVYTVALFAGDGSQPLTQSSVTVGGSGNGQGNGQTNPPAQGDVLVFGTVRDGDSGRPIRGAYFVVLQPGITYDQWDGSESAIYTFAETDAEGVFALPNLLAFDTPYTIVVGAKGYKTKFGDNLVWTTDDPVLYNFEVDLVK